MMNRRIDPCRRSTLRRFRGAGNDRRAEKGAKSTRSEPPCPAKPCGGLDAPKLEAAIAMARAGSEAIITALECVEEELPGRIGTRISAGA